MNSILAWTFVKWQERGHEGVARELWSCLWIWKVGNPVMLLTHCRPLLLPALPPCPVEQMYQVRPGSHLQPLRNPCRRHCRFPSQPLCDAR